jgi:uncharacterized lipoprotein YajG
MKRLLVFCALLMLAGCQNPGRFQTANDVPLAPMALALR